MPKITRAMLHKWEEPPISGERGAGAIFFSGCSLRCVYCQNREISTNGNIGKEFSPLELAELFKQLEGEGAECIDLVTPTHFSGKIREALLAYKPSIPVVYNSSGYERVETLRSLDGLIDVYLPDFKYLQRDLALSLSGAGDYPEVCLKAISEMVRQTGAPKYDSRGIMLRGTLIRHLILPGHTMNSILVLKAVKENFPEIPVSLMAQYTPPEDFPEGEKYPELKRKITKRELEKVEDVLFKLDLDGFVQDIDASKESFLPDFHQFG